MADDAAGTDDGADRRRRSSGSDSDTGYSIDDRSVFDAGGSTARDDDGGNDARSRDDEYRIPLDLSGDADAATDDGDPDGEESDAYAPEPNSTPIEPGDPDLESAIFVVLGAVAMAFVLFRVMTLPL